jgi:hypothetical protein
VNLFGNFYVYKTLDRDIAGFSERCSVVISVLNIKAVSLFEMLVTTYQTMQRPLNITSSLL